MAEHRKRVIDQNYLPPTFSIRILMRFLYIPGFSIFFLSIHCGYTHERPVRVHFLLHHEQTSCLRIPFYGLLLFYFCPIDQKEKEALFYFYNQK